MRNAIDKWYHPYGVLFNVEIAIVMHRLSKSRGGAEGWTTRLIQWLHKQSHSVHLVSSQEPTYEVAQCVDRLTLYPKCNRFAFSRLVSDDFDRSHIDVVHDMGFGYRCDLFQPHSGSQKALDEAHAKSYFGLARIGFEIRRRLGPRKRKLASLAERQFRQLSTRFLAVSQRVADDLVRFHEVPRERIHVIHNGVDTQLFSPAMRQTNRSIARQQLRADDTDFLILCVAHKHQLKGVSNLIKMLHSPSNSKIHLVVVGGQRQHPQERAIHQNRVTFVGVCDDVMPFYAAADLFVLLTDYDACSLTVLEAMACGLPVITTLANGASELIKDQHEGLLLSSSTDVPALIKSVETCRCDSLRNFLGRNARQRVMQHSLESNFAAIENIYREIAFKSRMAA